MDLIAALQFLNLNQVPQDWVDAVWDLEFTERQPLDAMMEDELAAAGEKSFRTLYRCLMEQAAEQQRSSGQEGVSQGVWVVLGDSGVSVKSLVAVLSHFILTAKAKEGGVQQRVCGLYAASVYLLLLGVPGSIANKVFHEVLLDTCSDLPSHCWPQEHGRKRKKDALKASQADGKRSKPQRRDAMEMDLEEEEEEEEQHFSGQDLMKIRDAIALLVQSLLRLLQTFPLKDRTQSASNCTQIFSKLLSFEPVVGELTFSPPRDLSELKSIPEMAFYGLKLLCSPKHGDQKESLRRVFYRLLYVILMMNKVHGRKPSLLVPNQAVLNTRDQAIHFVCHLVEELKDLALPLLQILLQHICFQMVEKSEYRSHGAQAVGMLTSQMVSVDYACFIKWLFSFSSHSKMVHRLFSVDVVMVLLAQPERSVEDCPDPELARFLPQKFLIQEVLFARRNDESPTVQGHALSCLAQCLELPSLNVTRAVHDLFSATGTQTVLEEELTAGTSGSQKSYRTLPFRTVELSSTSSSSCEAKENLALLLRRVGDPKTNVRKAALQALVGLLKHGVIPATWENLESLSERSRDPAVSVRKKALQCLGELLAAKPSCRAVQKAWLHCVVPAVMDTESSMQEKALELLDQVLLSQVKPYNERSLLDHSQSLTWDLLGLLCDESQNLSRYFSRAFSIWSKQNKFSPAFISSLVSHTQTDHAAGAWLLLSKAVSSVSRVPHGQILDAWDTMIRSDSVNVTSCCHILSVVGDVAAHLNEDTKERIIADLMSRLKTFRLPLEVISAAMDTLYQLGCSEDIRLTQAFLNQHCGELVSICEAYLAGIILNENKTQDLNEDLMIKHLHTLGAASLHCPAKVGRRTVLLVESVLTSPSKKLADGEEDLPTSQPLTQFRDNELPSSVKAHGVITLGKLCLQQEKLAQRYLPVFARELEVGPDVAVRNNVAVIMCDLCVRYTSMVDLYIPNVSACLRDNSAVVRENALIMLTNLLQEEFVKWKGSLFFRFMMALVDPVPAIASLCEYCLLHRLLKKNPEMFSQHFIECIFHFNSYDKHTSYNKFPQSDREKARFSLRGAQNREKRFRIYRFLLEHFTDAQRFNTTNKISQTVLACFAEEELPLDSDGAEVLSETFNVLSLKEFKLQAVSAPAGGAEESEEENVATMTKVVLQVAQRKVVSQVQKKAFIENTVPLIISLKNLLEQKRSPVLKDLMAYLQVTMQDYRNEVKEFFAGDEQLAAEVEFALNTAEKEREMAEKMESCSLTANGPTTLPKGSELLSPARRPLLPFNFTTPQPPPPSSGPTRLAHTDRRPVRPFRKEDHCRTKSMTPDKTAIVRGGAKDRAVSTPKGFEISLTFNEGLSAILSDPGTSFSGESSIRSNGQPAPGPRRWNVLSPLRQKKKSS
ncbi:PREDICTED: condensin-2 complex subunit D3 isoform X1 [Cyprinodon variegatus]|uniref:condensin-2 complex subunit D3 isoform X1 n=1 Tax=Cyprinodon variegatus TaxID=28743 RepID=UPI0007429A22|nr:PREDICTED: condensin-2 complex subunit D3 isoform X1 [Cyprinodon variegatus]